MSEPFNPELVLDCLCGAGMPGCKHASGKCGQKTKLKDATSPYFCNGCAGRRANIIESMIRRNLGGKSPFPDYVPPEWMNKKDA